MNKIPSIIEFCIAKGIDHKTIKVESSLDLTCDHSPIILTTHSQVVEKNMQYSLLNKKTDWHLFRGKLDTFIDLRIPLRTEADIDNAINDLTKHTKCSMVHYT